MKRGRIPLSLEDIQGRKPANSKLTPLHPLKKRMGGSVAWLCKCQCGSQMRVRGSDLATGRVLSCGCHPDKKERNKELLKRREEGATLRALAREFGISAQRVWYLLDREKKKIRQAS